MNGVHDMGGMQGFGPVQPEANEPVFHGRWEARVLAMRRAMLALREPADALIVDGREVVVATLTHPETIGGSDLMPFDNLHLVQKHY